ncbi:MAG: hypothetical protein Q4F05_12540 [bacterium]|nr:hypothetical protein [bacterium]
MLKQVKDMETEFGEKSEESISDQITVHNWPYGKPNTIFCIGENPEIKENIFAATNKGVSYLGSIDDFNLTYITNSNEFSNDIPLGYTALDIYERMMVVNKGNICWENKNILDLSSIKKEELEERKIEIFAHNKEEHYAVFLPDRSFDKKFCLGFGSVRYEEFFHIRANQKDLVIAAAKKYSAENNIPCMVAKRLYSCTWH